jgi:hypothetical protein
MSKHSDIMDLFKSIPSVNEHFRVQNQWDKILDKYLERTSTEQLIKDINEIGIGVMTKKDKYDRKQLESELKWMLFTMDAKEDGVEVGIYPVNKI